MWTLQQCQDEHLLSAKILFCLVLTNKHSFLCCKSTLCFNRNWLENCPLITLSCLTRSLHRSGDELEPVLNWMRVLFLKMARYGPQFLHRDYFNSHAAVTWPYLASFTVSSVVIHSTGNNLQRTFHIFIGLNNWIFNWIHILSFLACNYVAAS